MSLVHEVKDVRLIDTPRCWVIQKWILFDNSYNYDQSYQWVSVRSGQYTTFREALGRYREELSLCGYLPTNGD